MSMELNEIVKNVDCLISEFQNKYGSIKTENQNWCDNDIRFELLGLPANKLVSYKIGLESLHSTILEKDWWHKNISPNKDMGQIQKYADQYVLDQKVTAFILYFSAVEAKLRELVRKLCPGACSNGFASFDSIYNKIFKTLSIQQHKNVMDFSRTIRNLIHNNGTYINDKRQTDCEFEFKGNVYKFMHGKKVDFAYAELLLELKREIFLVLCEILDHNKVRRMS